jgi:predicted HNH restriction endonuclease
MRTVENIKELKSNLALFETYLSEGSDQENQAVNKLIAGGKCFVTYKINNEWRFAPSRFIGYYDNDLEKHANNSSKDGKVTNPAINRIADNRLKESEILEAKYLDYCKGFGIEPHNTKRRYWLFDFKDEEFTSNVNTNEGFPEGKIVERKHKARERNSELVRLAKKKYREKYGSLCCQVCNFDFEEAFGAIGKDYIEAHHTIPVSEMGKGYETKIEEIAIVCSNCHKMLHRKRPWLRIDELKKIR